LSGEYQQGLMRVIMSAIDTDSLILSYV